MKKLSSVLIFILVIIGCNHNNETYPNFSLDTASLKIDIKINKIEYTTTNDNPNTILRGVIKIKNNSNASMEFNLNNVKIINAYKDTLDIYIQSIATILKQKEKIIPQGLIEKEVYWVFPKKIPEQDLKKMEILYE